MRFPIDLPSWQALCQDFEKIKHTHLNDLFASDSDRADRYCLTVGGVYLDYAKNRVNDEIIAHLCSLAYEAGVDEGIRAMFRGDKINRTENRAVLHTALRNRSNVPVWVDGCDVMPEVNRVLDQMADFSDAVRDGAWLGFSGKVITDVVNIGIGGSDVGANMVCGALHRFAHPRLKIHFVSNVDGVQLRDTLKLMNPETTLFIIASKTFTTQETMTNATTARQWFLQYAGESDIARHFVAVSTNRQAVEAFGIDSNNMFEFWDWVGGRYSLWSAVGLPIMLSLGREHFIEMLEGAHLMDCHFAQSPFERNMPVLLALIGIWYINFHKIGTQVIAPYDHYLNHFPKWIQQVDMESNGKQTRMDGTAVACETGPIIWGESGINGQHAFFQLLHQGTQQVPIDFIVSMQKRENLPGHHEILLSNAIAQAEAFMRGKSADQARFEMKEQGLSDEQIEALLPHKVFQGNRPSNMIAIDRVCPRHLGSLIALYEHKVFVQGLIWGINSFDQWGVELGKQLAKTVLSELKNEMPAQSHDASTAKLIRRYLQNNCEVDGTCHLYS